MADNSKFPGAKNLAVGQGRPCYTSEGRLFRLLDLSVFTFEISTLNDSVICGFVIARFPKELPRKGEKEEIIFFVYICISSEG